MAKIKQKEMTKKKRNSILFSIKEKYELSKTEQLFMLYIGAVGALCIVLAGGFFEYVSCLAIILLGGACLFKVIKNNSFVGGLGFNESVLLVILTAYFFSRLWAVDKGMSTLGFYKFLPAFLMLLILNSLGDKKEIYINFLPFTGSVITIITFIMSHIDSMTDKVSVAGRLAGSFEYPNTFAAFLLVCLIVAAYSECKAAIIYSLVLLFGIYQTGSRTVLLLTALAAVLLFVFNNKVRKYIVVFLVSGLLLVIVLLVSGKLNLENSLSTMYGRFLYWMDSLRIILKHPFGLGYYGYYFTQGEYQTGVYTVMNAHNEYIQMALDIGVIPAIMFVVMIIRQIFDKQKEIRDKIAIALLALHAFADYDFQFIAMWFVSLLFFSKSKSEGKRNTIRYGVTLKVMVVGLFAFVFYGAFTHGMSMYHYNRGEIEKAAKEEFNTMANIYQMMKADSSEVIKEYGEKVIGKNSKASVAYQYIAAYYFQAGDAEKFMENQEKAIRLNPYNREMYEEYIDALYNIALYYEEDEKVCRLCNERAIYAKSLLDKTVEKTSRLAWKIQDKPKLTLTENSKKQLKELERLSGRSK